MTKTQRTDQTDTCPNHGGTASSEYDFGQGDATVTTYRGCGCATCLDSERGWMNGATIHTNYREAAGVARLISLQNAAR